MAVKIRLSRIGKKHAPFFRIVAVDGRKKRDGAFLENLGTYDALKTQVVQFHEDRLNTWLAQGAIPTDAVKKIQKLHKKSQQATQEPVALVEKKKSSGSKKTTKKPAVAA